MQSCASSQVAADSGMCSSLGTGLVSGACVQPVLEQERVSTPGSSHVAGVVTAQSFISCPIAATITALHSVQCCTVSQVAACPGMCSSLGTVLVSGADVHPVLEQERVSMPGSSHVAGVVTAQSLMS